MMSQLVPLFAHTVGFQDLAGRYLGYISTPLLLLNERAEFTGEEDFGVLARSLDLDSARPTLARPYERFHQKWCHHPPRENSPRIELLRVAMRVNDRSILGCLEYRTLCGRRGAVAQLLLEVAKRPHRNSRRVPTAVVSKMLLLQDHGQPDTTHQSPWHSATIRLSIVRPPAAPSPPTGTLRVGLKGPGWANLAPRPQGPGGERF